MSKRFLNKATCTYKKMGYAFSLDVFTSYLGSLSNELKIFQKHSQIIEKYGYFQIKLTKMLCEFIFMKSV